MKSFFMEAKILSNCEAMPQPAEEQKLRYSWHLKTWPQKREKLGHATCQFL